MMFALIFDGKVVQIESQEFPVAPALEWVGITGLSPQPQVGWLYNGVVFSAPPPPPSPPPDSNILLDAAIDSATTLTALKAALRGKVVARQ